MKISGVARSRWEDFFRKSKGDPPPLDRVLHDLEPLSSEESFEMKVFVPAKGYSSPDYQEFVFIVTPDTEIEGGLVLVAVKRRLPHYIRGVDADAIPPVFDSMPTDPSWASIALLDGRINAVNYWLKLHSAAHPHHRYYIGQKSNLLKAKDDTLERLVREGGPALDSRVAALEKEVAELRELIQTALKPSAKPKKA